MPSIKDLRERLACYPDGMACAWALWTPPDVTDTMKDRRFADREEGRRLQPNLDDEEIRDILNRVHGHQDAALGITWQSIECELPAEDLRDARVITRLKPGVRIKWFDPDAGACSVEGVIANLQLADHLVLLNLEDGWAGEALASELEIVEEDDIEDE